MTRFDMAMAAARSPARRLGLSQCLRSVRRFIVPAGALLPLLALLAACAAPQQAVLSTDQQTALDQAAAYLNNLRSFRAAFIQAGPKGLERGVVWLDRPGRMRVDYKSPSPETIVANNGRLLIVNPGTGATTTMPVSKTPLDILLRRNIPLSGPVTVTAVHRSPQALTLSLVKTTYPEQGTLTLVFNARPLALRGLILTDLHGRVTRLALQDIQRNPTIPANLFSAQMAQPVVVPAG